MQTARTTSLRKARLQGGLLQCELAYEAQVNNSSLCMWERGWKRPTLPTAEKLANALGCKVDDIFDPAELKPY